MDQRIQFIRMVNESDESFTALCERFGITDHTTRLVLKLRARPGAV